MVPESQSLPVDAETQQLFESAQKRLATKLEVPIEAVTFVHYQPRIWPDGSMGCPQAGKTFTPVEIPGYVMRLQVDGVFYDFHGGMGKRPFLCQEKPGKDTGVGEIILPPPDYNE